MMTRATGAPAQGLNPNSKPQDSGEHLLPSGSTDLTVNLHFYSELTCAPIKYALSYININLHVLVIFVTITWTLCNIQFKINI
jgi:hypothetical protein